MLVYVILITASDQSDSQQGALILPGSEVVIGTSYSVPLLCTEYSCTHLSYKPGLPTKTKTVDIN